MQDAEIREGQILTCIMLNVDIHRGNRDLGLFLKTFLKVKVIEVVEGSLKIVDKLLDKYN